MNRTRNHAVAQRPPYLQLVLGWPYMVTDQIDRARGIVKGLRCTLVDVIIERGVHPDFDVDRYCHTISCEHVTGLVLRIEDSSGSGSKLTSFDFNSDLPPGVFILTSKVTAKINLNDRQWRCKKTLTQFALVNAVTSTVHKTQCKSMSQVNIPAWSKFNSALAYVGLSRVTSKQGLRLGEAIQPHMFKPRTYVKIELEREKIAYAKYRQRCDPDSDSTRREQQTIIEEATDRIESLIGSTTRPRNRKRKRQSSSFTNVTSLA